MKTPAYFLLGCLCLSLLPACSSSSAVSANEFNSPQAQQVRASNMATLNPLQNRLAGD